MVGKFSNAIFKKGKFLCITQLIFCALLFVMMMVRVMAIPLLDNSEELNESSEMVATEYRTLFRADFEPRHGKLR